MARWLILALFLFGCVPYPQPPRPPIVTEHCVNWGCDGNMES